MSGAQARASWRQRWHRRGAVLPTVQVWRAAVGWPHLLLLACVSVVALPGALQAGRPGEDMAQALTAQPRRREGAGAPERLFRNLRIMVHAEVPCLSLHWPPVTPRARFPHVVPPPATPNARHED